MEYRFSVVVCALRPAKLIQSMGGALWLAFGLKGNPAHSLSLCRSCSRQDSVEPLRKVGGCFRAFGYSSHIKPFDGISKQI